MEFKVSIAPLAKILCRLAEAIIDPFERWQMRMEDRVFIRERRENEKRDVELAAVQANWDRAQKHNDDALDVFRQNRDLYERQALALEKMVATMDTLAIALAHRCAMHAPEPEKKPMQKVRR